MDSGVAQTLVRQVSWIAFFATILMAWAWLYSMSVHMGMTPFGTMRAGMSMGMTSMSSLSVLVPMWTVMMAAMMGPTFVPTVRTYEDLIQSGAGTRSGFCGLILGYLGAWLCAGVVIAVLHAVFQRTGLVSGMGVSASALFSAALLMLAGAYQLTDAKDRCLSYCRNPMSHFLSDWRDGFSGSARSGARIGLYCIACCWAIMLLGFVGGAMNLIWMGIAVTIMTLEKLPDIGRWLTRPLGICFVAAGFWHLTQLI